MTFFIKNLDHADPVVQEHATICIARALDKYVHDERAYEPLVRMLSAPAPNTRTWAIEGLAALTVDFVPHAIAMLGDRAARIREAALDQLAMAVAKDGGGTLHRPRLGVIARRQLGEAMVSYDLTQLVGERTSRAFLLAEVAEPDHLPVLEAWFQKDKSQAVRVHLQTGIDRLKGK
jgi:hypothetical protein